VRGPTGLDFQGCSRPHGHTSNSDFQRADENATEILVSNSQVPCFFLFFSAHDLTGRRQGVMVLGCSVTETRFRLVHGSFRAHVFKFDPFKVEASSRGFTPRRNLLSFRDGIIATLQPSGPTLLSTRDGNREIAESTCKGTRVLSNSSHHRHHRQSASTSPAIIQALL
jgi:hypothetical protein